MRKILFLHLLMCISFLGFSQIGVNDANALMALPQATNFTEIDAILNPQIGSVIYNLDDDQIYRYTGTTNGWRRGLGEMSVFTDAFLVNAPGGTVTTTFSQAINGLPFQPSQITFVAHANVDSFDLDSDNGTDNNDLGIPNSFGSMNGFSRDTGTASPAEQVIYVGGHGNSINDISTYASSSNCIGIRFSSQNGNDLGKITGSVNTFDPTGFTLDITYTIGTVTNNSATPRIDVQPEDVFSESLIVLFTAYK